MGFPVLAASGRPVLAYFRYTGARLNLTNGAWTLLQWDTLEKNINAIYDLSAETFTVPYSGIYAMHTCVRIFHNDASSIVFDVALRHTADGTPLKTSDGGNAHEIQIGSNTSDPLYFCDTQELIKGQVLKSEIYVGGSKLQQRGGSPTGWLITRVA